MTLVTMLICKERRVSERPMLPLIRMYMHLREIGGHLLSRRRGLIAIARRLMRMGYIRGVGGQQEARCFRVSVAGTARLAKRVFDVSATRLSAITTCGVDDATM